MAHAALVSSKFEQIDEMKQAQQQMHLQQQQQQLMQQRQMMNGPPAQQPNQGFMQPASSMAFTPVPGQMTGPATPGSDRDDRVSYMYSYIAILVTV